MTTRITDFHQPSTVTVQSLETGGSGVSSSFGPANVLRLRSNATMWSTSGAQLSLKSLGANSLLLAKSVEIIMPVEIRWQDANNNLLLPNMYDEIWGSNLTDNSFGGVAQTVRLNTSAYERNSISVRPLGFLRSIQNMVITINGSSFQCRPDEFLDAYEAIYYNGRYDDDGATASPPFNNIGSASKPAISEPGRFQRCMNLVKNTNLVHVGHWTPANHGNDNKLNDAVYQYNLKTKLPLAFFIYSVFPALENLTGNSLDSAAHITDLAVEYTFKNECPLMHWFAEPCTEITNSQGIDITDRRYIGTDRMAQRMNTTGESGVDCQRMWNTAVALETSIASTPNVYVNIKRPYLSYIMTEPDVSKTPLLSAYTMPGINFVSYSKEVAIAGTKEKESVNFDYIKIDKLSPLITITVCDAEKDGVNGAVGARTARFSAGAYNQFRRGMSYSGVTCPIDYNSLKINLSVRNQVLGSLDGSLCTERDFWRIFNKYSKLKYSFSDWQKYMKGVLVFSPMELVGVGFSGAYAPYTLSISFDFARAYGDTELISRDYAKLKGSGGIEMPTNKWSGRNMNYKVTLCFLQESLITVSPGACGIEYPRFSQQEAAAQFSGAQVRLDENVLDQYVSTAQ